jgi:hypothetical protein
MGAMVTDALMRMSNQRASVPHLEDVTPYNQFFQESE